MSVRADESPLVIDIEARTDVGCVREANEDSFSVIDEPAVELLGARGRMVLVADGMGGALGGETASSIVTHVVPDAYFHGSNEISIADALASAVQMANAEVFAQAGESSELRGMGSTCTAAVVHDDALWYAHVGDSRLYLVREGEIEQLTVDHSKVAQLVADNRLHPDDVASHPERSVLLRSIGPRATVEVDVAPEPIPLRAGDRLLLCSDGLTGHVSDGEIRDLVSEEAPSDAVTSLIELAKVRGGDDNITVAVLRVSDPACRIPTTLEARRVEPPTTAPEADATDADAAAGRGRKLRLAAIALIVLAVLGVLAWAMVERPQRRAGNQSPGALRADAGTSAGVRENAVSDETDSSSAADVGAAVSDVGITDGTVGDSGDGTDANDGAAPAKALLSDSKRARAVNYFLSNLPRWRTHCPDFEMQLRSALEDKLQRPFDETGSIEEQVGRLVDAIAEFQQRHIDRAAGRPQMQVDGMPGQRTQQVLLNGSSCPDANPPR